MPRVKRLTPAAEWSELSTTAADWKAADPALLATMLGQLHLIRAFEETVLELAGEGLVHGPAHSSIGQEGGAVGSIAGLRSSDAVNGSHRGHHQFLAKALTHVTKGALSLDALVTPEVAEVLQRTLAEILGLAQGYCAGRGGSMHLQWFEAGALGTNAIVGGGVPMATGNAWAQKHSAAGPDGTDLTVTYFGDGAVNIGSVLESLNLASAWKLPVCFFMENNGYAVSTTVEEATGEPRLSARALGFGITSWRVDGMDPLAVHLVMEKAAGKLRAGQGPVVVEALVYRFFHQNGPYPGSAFGYRTKEEEAGWRARDPLDRVAREMTRLGLIDEAGVAAVRAQAAEAMRAAAAALVEPDPAPGAKAGARRIRPGLWPDPAFVNVGVRGDLSELAGARTAERSQFTGQLRRGKFIDAVSAVMDRRMATDPRIIVLGEDVHKLAGGTNGATKGLPGKYPGRVLGTPISENAFAGLGRRARARRPVPAGRGVHVPGLPVGGRRPGVQPDRQGQAHVRRPEPGAPGAADEGRHGIRVRVAAPHGPGGHLRHLGRLADHGRVHPVRLRRADEHGAGGRRPGAHARARRPVRVRRRHPGR